MPSEIPMPETFENEEFSDYLEIPPYTAVRAEVCERNTNTIWETAFEDDFSSGDLSKWHGGEEFENINGAMAVNVFNRTIYPNGVGASENISISFDFKDYMDNFFVKFYNEEDETDCFYVNCKSNKLWDVSQVKARRCGILAQFRERNSAGGGKKHKIYARRRSDNPVYKACGRSRVFGNRDIFMGA